MVPTNWDRTKMKLLRIPGRDESMFEPFTQECHCRRSWIMRLSVPQRLCAAQQNLLWSFFVFFFLLFSMFCSQKHIFPSSRFTHSCAHRLASFWWSAYEHKHYLRFETRKGKNANKEVPRNSIQRKRHLFTAHCLWWRLTQQHRPSTRLVAYYALYIGLGIVRKECPEKCIRW